MNCEIVALLKLLMMSSGYNISHRFDETEVTIIDVYFLEHTQGQTVNYTVALNFLGHYRS